MDAGSSSREVAVDPGLNELLATLDAALRAQVASLLASVDLPRDPEGLATFALPRCQSADHATHQLERWLAVAGFFREHPQELQSFAVTPAVLQSAVAAAVVACYAHQGDDGCQAGLDIDGVVRRYWNADLAPVVVAALRVAAGGPHRALPRTVELARRSAEVMAPRFIAYARGETVAYRGLNLMFQDIAGMAEAGAYFAREDWSAAAELARRRAFARQHDEGYFPDSRDPDLARGPSSTYQAYAFFTLTGLLMLHPDDDTGRRIARALRWMLRNTYTDGETFEIVDERERYHLHRHPAAAATFTPVMAYCRGGRQMIAAKLATGLPPDATSTARFWLLTWAVRAANPRFLDLLEEAGDWAAARRRFAHVDADRRSAAVVSQPWTITAHGYLAPALAPMSMWHRDLQQHVALHHRAAGVIFGGGNSLAQPEFSTLVVGASFLCEQVTVEDCDAAMLSIALRNAGARVRLECRVVSEAECRITAQVIAAAAEPSFLQLPLCFYDHREALSCGGARITAFGEHPCSGSFADAIEVHGRADAGPFVARISFSSPPSYQWPVVPVDVRAPGRRPMPFANAVLPLRFALGAAGSRIVVGVRVDVGAGRTGAERPQAAHPPRADDGDWTA